MLVLVDGFFTALRFQHPINDFPVLLYEIRLMNVVDAKGKGGQVVLD
jgi:hypothetical protein